MNLATLKRDIERLDKQHKEAMRRKKELLKQRAIACSGCGKKSRISSWSFIQVTWAAPVFSCNGGGHLAYAVTEDCSIRCPKCGKESDIFHHPAKEKILALLTEDFTAEDLFGKYEVRHSSY